MVRAALLDISVLFCAQGAVTDICCDNVYEKCFGVTCTCRRCLLPLAMHNSHGLYYCFGRECGFSLIYFCWLHACMRRQCGYPTGVNPRLRMYVSACVRACISACGR